MAALFVLLMIDMAYTWEDVAHTREHIGYLLNRVNVPYSISVACAQTVNEVDRTAYQALQSTLGPIRNALLVANGVLCGLFGGAAYRARRQHTAERGA